MVGFPRPKQMSAVLSSCLQKATDSRVATLLSPGASPHFLAGQGHSPVSTRLAEHESYVRVPVIQKPETASDDLLS